MTSKPMTLPADYGAWLTSIKRRIQGARQRAVLSANAEQIRLYHEISREILERQARETDGAQRLSTASRPIFGQRFPT